MKPQPLNQPDDRDQPEEAGQEIVEDLSPGDLEIEKKWLQLARIDIEKFELLYKKYRPRIFQYIYLTVQDVDQASNFTDETFSRAVDKLDSFKWQGYSFGAWLYKIAHNVMGHDFRRRKARPEVRFDPEFHDRDNGCRPDRDAEIESETCLLMNCVDRLKPESREVFVNYYGLGMTTREVSVVMDMPESSVKSHLQRGRKKLMRYLVANGMDRRISSRSKNIIREAAIREDGWEVMGPLEGTSSDE